LMSAVAPISHLGARSCEVRFSSMSRYREFDRVRRKRRRSGKAK
jgi:hypothetical protein